MSKLIYLQLEFNFFFTDTCPGSGGQKADYERDSSRYLNYLTGLQSSNRFRWECKCLTHSTRVEAQRNDFEVHPSRHFWLRWFAASETNEKRFRVNFKFVLLRITSHCTSSL